MRGVTAGQWFCHPGRLSGTQCDVQGPLPAPRVWPRFTAGNSLGREHSGHITSVNPVRDNSPSHSPELLRLGSAGRDVSDITVATHARGKPRQNPNNGLRKVAREARHTAQEYRRSLPLNCATVNTGGLRGLSCEVIHMDLVIEYVALVVLIGTLASLRRARR